MVRHYSRGLFGLCIFVAGVSVMNAVSASDHGDVSDAPRVACFGRFMIDLPGGAEVPGHRSDYMFGRLESARSSSNGGVFAHAMERREEAIKQGKDNKGYGFVATHRPSATSRIFVSELEAFGSQLYRVEFHSLHGDVHFSLAQGPYNDRTIDDTVERLQSALLAGLRARANGEIPAEPGLCIKHGFIATDGSERAHESFQISLDFKQWPDMELTVSSSTVRKAEPSLLERVGAAKVPVEYLPLLRHIKTVRKGRRDVDGYTGEELLQMMPSDGGYKTHTFRWESHFALNDPFKPMLAVELTTGHLSEWLNKRPTISEEDAIKLFDAVVNSIRLRPTTPAKPKFEPKAALGTPQVTGRSCPQSGVWQAEDGERRFLNEGETMPAVHVARKPSLLDRLRGERPLERRATMWTLVAYAPDATPGATSDDSSAT